MATNYGTLSVSDLLATTSQSVIQFGEDDVFNAIAADLAVHNARTNEMMGALVDITTDRRRRYGGVDQMEMVDLDEYGTPDAQKVSAGDTMDFPLGAAGIAVQWTLKYLKNNTPAELAAQYVAVRSADIRNLERALKRAIFTPTNRTVVDRLTDRTSLSVKALVNADGADVPLGPEGTSFDGSTHTHYLGTSSFVAADLTALIDTVIEHHNLGTPMVYINRAQEAAVRAFTGFTAYLDARLVATNTVNQARGTLDQMNPNNRAIGLFGAAEVWVKPWIPANYAFAWVSNNPARPIVMRVRNIGDGLDLTADDESHPLRAQVMEREFGFGAWNRTNGAALRTNNATYAAPTFS
jgi:hypothetical protein